MASNKKQPLDLRKKKPQVAAAAPAVAKPGQPLAQPRSGSSLPVGTIIRGDTPLTPMEEKLLREAGWNPGDPVPSTLPSIVLDAQKALQEEARTALPAAPDRPPLRMPTPIRLEDLPLEHQQRILNEMKAVKEQAASAMEVAKHFQPMLVKGAGPGINEAIAAAAAASGAPTPMPQTKGPGTVPVTAPPPPFQPQPAPPPPSQQQPDPVSEATTTTPSDLTGATTSGQKEKCDHCGWPRDKPEPAENPSLEDRRDFLQSILGGNRFRKVYELCGGALKVVFRTLTTEEADLAFTQTAVDNVGLPTSGDAPYEAERRFFRTLLDYRLCLAIDSVYRGDIKIELPESLDEWLTDQPPRGQTKMVYILRHIYEEVFPAEPIRRMVGPTFVQFQHLVELMEARTMDADFWKAIEGQR